jgi:hypothetical protein
MKLAGIRQARAATANRPQSLDGADGCVKTRPEQKMRKRTKTEPEELLAAIAEAVDDGFCPASSLVSQFPKLSHREFVRLRGSAGFCSSAADRTGRSTSP